MTTLKLMGERIKSRREKLKLSQSALAGAVDLSESSRTSIAKWEKGKAYPDTDTIRLLCEHLDCDAGYLFGEYDAPHRITADIEEQTGFGFEASDKLKWFGKRTDNSTSAEKQLIEDLLCSEQLYHLAAIYREYKEIYSCADYAKITEADDYIQLPSGRQFLAIEADREKEIALFRFQKAIIAFAEGNKKEQK